MWFFMVWRLGLFGPLALIGASSRQWGLFGLRLSSSGEGDPGRLEDVFAALAGDGAETPVLETQETVKGAGGDEVGHLQLPAELARGSFRSEEHTSELQSR